MVAQVAAEDFDGVTFNEALKRLLREHRHQKVREDFARLQQDPEEWASYMAEVDEWERAGVADLRERLRNE